VTNPFLARFVPRLATFLGPLLVLAPPLLWWGRPAEPQALDETAVRLEAAVAGDPDVVLLGASKVWTDLDPGQLARDLGLKPTDVVRANVSGSRAAVWYAILENRIFGSGATPKVVVIYTSFEYLLHAVPTSAVERAMLTAQMGPDEPVLRQKSLGQDGGAAGALMERVRGRRTDYHRDLMAALRDGAVGLLLGEPGKGPVEAGAEIAGPALERLFGLDAAVDAYATHRAIPVVEAERTNGAVTLDDLDATLVPDLVALAKAHGARLVVAVAPHRQGAERPGAYAPELLPETVALLNAEGMGFMDLRDLALGDSAFGDAVHLNHVGRTQMTRALAERLEEMGALGDGPIAAAKVPTTLARPVVHRTGTSPALPAVVPTRGPGPCGWLAPLDGLAGISDTALSTAGFGPFSPVRLLEGGAALDPHATRERFDTSCGGAYSHQQGSIKFSPTGDDPEAVATRTYTYDLDPAVPQLVGKGQEVWWVYPGTALEFAFPEGVAPGPFAVAVAATPAIAGADGAGATVSVDTLPPTPLTSNGVALRAELAPPAPTGPWTLRVSSPTDGPWLLLRDVRVGDPSDPNMIIGAGGKSSAALLTPTAVWDNEPPALPPGAVSRTADGLAQIDFKGGEIPDLAHLYKVGGVTDCSPLTATVDGRTLSRVARKAAATKQPETFAQVGLSVFVNTTSGTPAIALDPKRPCQGKRWLYPGDRVTFSVPASRVGTLLAPGRRLEIGGAVASPTPTERALHVRLLAGQEVLVDTELALELLRLGPTAVDIPRNVVTEALTLELSTPADAPFFLLTYAAVAE
jgi:hypothetical protein